MSEIVSNTRPAMQSKAGEDVQKMRQASRDLEAAFLALMLKESGFGKTPDAFGGGAGEEQFSSFLVQAQADRIVEAGGIGLAEQIFLSLIEKADLTEVEHDLEP